MTLQQTQKTPQEPTESADQGRAPFIHIILAGDWYPDGLAPDAFVTAPDGLSLDEAFVTAQ